MTKETIIAVDAMGGDGGPKIIMPSLREFISENKNTKIKEKFAKANKFWISNSNY